LLALHNITFLITLMARARQELTHGNYTTWSSDWLRRYRRLG
jgi:queuine/archaeosine tRNA-ribosyltransferase